METRFALIEMVITVLVCGLWVFVLNVVRPRWIQRTARQRLTMSLIEGVGWALAWIGLRALLGNAITVEPVATAVLSGALWVIIATYARGRYHAAQADTPMSSTSL